MKTLPVRNARQLSEKPWLFVRNLGRATVEGPAMEEDDDGDETDETKPVELLIIGAIGTNPWDDSGVSELEFRNALARIPANREIVVGINSEGGSVKDGLGIYNAIRARADRITCRIDGYAVSIASIIALAGSKTVSPATSIWMIHDPWSLEVGNADQMRKAADMLDVHAETLVAAYSAKCGKEPDEIRAAMKAETWMTGEQAVEFGLCDLLIEHVSSDDECCDSVKTRVLNTYPKAKQAFAMISARREPAADKGLAGAPAQDNTNTKGTMTPNTTTTVPTAGVPTTPPQDNTPKPQAPVNDNHDTKLGAQAMAEIHALKEALAAQRKVAITARIDDLIADRRIPAAQRDKWIGRAVADESVLDSLAELPQHLPADGRRVDMISPDVRDIANGMNVAQKAIESWKAGNADWRSVANESRMAAICFRDNRDKMLKVVGDAWNGQVFNASSTNTIDSNIQRQVILNEVIRAFKKQILPLSAFSTVYSNMALQGTDVIAVPYYPLNTSASTDFVVGTGYTTNSNTSDSAKSLTVNKRKYKAFTYSSATLRRQPWFSALTHLTLCSQQLGVDVFTDVLSVVTAANYGAAAVTKPSSAFDYEDVVNLSVAARQAFWPEMGRNLILDAAYDGNARKDLRFVSALNSGSTETLREGVISRAASFDIWPSAMIPTNSENLVGFINVPSAIIAATAPIEPAPGVRQLLVRFELVTDPETGISFTYRHGGNATTDEDQEVIECAYGYAAGEAAALKRITSA